MRVLIVDDSRLARLELKEQLKKIGGIDLITEAANTRDALQIITEHQPDVLLLDINMPGEDGLTTLRGLMRPRAKRLSTRPSTLWKPKGLARV